VNPITLAALPNAAPGWDAISELALVLGSASALVSTKSAALLSLLVSVLAVGLQLPSVWTRVWNKRRCPGDRQIEFGVS
jgi:hypothetical protein